jgi:PAS domain S-box-containing protein
MISLHTLSNSLLSVINNAILVVDHEDRISFANHKASIMFKAGRSAQLIGQPMTRLFLPEDREILVANLLQLARSETDFEEEVMLLRFDGARFFALVSTAQFQVEAKTYIILSIHNISGLKGIEKALKHTERTASLGRMLDDINHQIRNPVSVIGGLAKRLIKQSAADCRYTQAILDEAERLEGLLETLSIFAKVPQPEVRPVTLGVLAQAITDVISPRAEAAGCPLLVRCPDNLRSATVAIDQGLLLQAIAALVDNACEAYEAGQQSVSLEIGTSGKSLPYRSSVIDQGSGISAVDRPKVFAPFFTRKTGSHGMGLTLAQKIITEQGGEIIIESTHGQGSVVHVLLAAERRRPIRTRLLEMDNTNG